MRVPGTVILQAIAQEWHTALRVSLWTPVAPHQGTTLPPPPALLSTFGVARDQAGGEKLWTSLLSAAGAPLQKVPLAPWCAGLPPVVSTAGTPGALAWLPELQSAIAFAWLTLSHPVRNAAPSAAPEPLPAAAVHVLDLALA